MKHPRFTGEGPACGLALALRAPAPCIRPCIMCIALPLPPLWLAVSCMRTHAHPPSPGPSPTCGRCPQVSLHGLAAGGTPMQLHHLSRRTRDASSAVMPPHHADGADPSEGKTGSGR